MVDYCSLPLLVVRHHLLIVRAVYYQPSIYYHLLVIQAVFGAVYYQPVLGLIQAVFQAVFGAVCQPVLGHLLHLFGELFGLQINLF